VTAVRDKIVTQGWPINCTQCRKVKVQGTNSSKQKRYSLYIYKQINVSECLLPFWTYIKIVVCVRAKIHAVRKDRFSCSQRKLLRKCLHRLQEKLY